MPEYIEREAAIKFVKELMEEVNNKTAINGSYVTKTYDMAIRHATKLLRYVPTAYPKADVVEVVRGRWIKRQFADEPTAFGYSCSKCHLTYEVDTNYCPNCGAKMDGGNNNADADRCVCCGEIVPESRQVCPQCERKRYIYTIPDIPPSLNKYAGRENVWAYRADKKQWQALCAVYCRPKPSAPIKKCVVRITYFFRTMQRHDPDNYSGKFILDGLREAGIIEDDSFSNVMLLLCGDYDKENPRTEIMIKEL